MSNQLPSFDLQINKDGYYDVYRILYASELDFHWVATFKWKEDAEEYMENNK